MASSATPAAKEPAPATTALSQAADRLRESAKWTLVAFAAVGVVLAGGLQLADIGELTWDDPGRLLVAAAGLCLAIAGIAVAVSAASRVVSSSSVNMGTLLSSSQLEPVRTGIDADQDGLLGNQGTVATLRQNFTAASIAANDAFEATLDARDVENLTESEKAELIGAADASFASANAELNRLKGIRDRVLDVASYRSVLRSYERARRVIAFGAAAAAIGIVLFAWGANPPQSQSIDAGEILPKTPSEVTVVYTAPPATLQDRLGPKCDLANVDAVAVSTKGNAWQVATEKTDDCRSVWLTVKPNQGEVIRRQPPPSPPDSGTGETG
jgi:hypothetical protein